MELSAVILVVILLWVFKRSVKKIAVHTDRVITNELNEGIEEMIDNATLTFKRIHDKYGEDYRTPDDVFKLLSSKMAKNSSN